MRWRNRLTRAALLITMLASFSTARAGEIGWLESYSLAADREAALKQLIPGTEDFYYYHCLHYQNTEQWEKVEATLKSWVERYQWTARAIEIQNRQALLTYGQNPGRALELIRNRLSLQFNHQRELLNQKPNLPTKLDPALLSAENLNKQAFAQFPNSLQGFEEAALDWLVAAELNPEQRRQLLARLQRPDYPGLVKLIVADLEFQNSGGFGQWEIHRRLLRSQLDELVALKPELLNQQNYVETYLVRLQPTADENWRQDRVALSAYLERLWAFVSKLAPVHNSLKAHVLYHQLVLDRQQGKYDAARFLEYLRLPKHTPYVAPKYMEPIERQQQACNLGQDFPATLLPPVGNDEPLVRSYLMHFFVEAKDFSAYTEYVHDRYLKQVFAETKIVNGLGDGEKWFSLLPPETLQQLRERIDIDFAFTNKTEFAVDDPVALDVYLKNVDTLIVKVFEINTQNFYRQNLREVDTDINLDGLVANEEKTHTYKEPALRRVRRHFEFPALDKRGVYVIDFIGNGRASRALVRKGKLRFLSRTSVAGQVFTILDENREPAPKATLWLGGTLYTPDKDGEIITPFSNQPGRQPVVISDGNFSSLQFFEQATEQYRLDVGFYVDREELIARRKALLTVRPQLWLGGTAVTRKILEDVRLGITSTDLDGVVSTTEVPDFKLFEDRESTHEFQVPQRLASIRFVLLARVQNRSQNRKQDLAAEQTFSLNEIDRTDKTEDLHFTRDGESYVLDLLGKTGEARPDRAVNFSFKLKDYTQQVSVTLQTNERGRIELGPLPGVATVTASSPQGVSHTWPLRMDAHTYPQAIHGAATDALEVPFMSLGKPTRDEVSLLELRGGSFVTDRYENVELDGSLLKIGKLAPGDYSLLLKKSGTHILLRVTEGVQRKNYLLGDYRGLELRNTKPLQLLPAKVDEETVTLSLQNSGPLARLHVFATRFQPAYSAYDNLARGATTPGFLEMLRSESQYIAGRDIGDEFRYIIDRRFARKFPGNMLERPSLLLNPWAIRSTETTQQTAATGGEFGGVGAMKEQLARSGAHGGEAAPPPGDFASLDFLAESSLVLINLVPDEKGVVTIKRKDLDPHQQLLFLAVDPQNTASRIVVLPEAKPDYLDLRLAKGLDPKQHFTQQKRISVLQAGDELVIADFTSTRFEMYDTLARMYMLYAALNNDGKLTEFSFVRTWSSKKLAEKRELYKQYASHDMHFFLAQKDPEFFKEVILPYLKNKKDKQFVDRWLLVDDAKSFLRSWDFEQLNTFERILLGQRVAGEAATTARLVKDQFELLPPDPDRFAHLFETALKGNALGTDDTIGWGAAVEKGNEPRFFSERPESVANADEAQADAFAAPAEEAAGAPAPAVAASKPAGRQRDNGRMAGKKLQGEKRKQLAESKDRGALRFRESDAKAIGAEMEELAADYDKLGEVAQLYLKLDKTMEWVESNYYHLPIEQQNAALIAVNSFWKDYAAHDAAKPFLATTAADATHNFHEMLAALSLLDLPFDAKKHTTKFEGTKMTLTAAGPMIVYHEEIQPADKVAENTPILVSQNFYRNGERHRMVNSEQVDKFVSEEFLVDVVYGCHIVVTNPSSSRKKVEVLLQIPTGAMPVQNGQFTKSVHLDLEPYHTQTLEYFFYFPAAGKFAHYPVQISSGSEVLAFAAPFEFNVVKELTNIDKQSWDYVSQHGTPEQVLEFLKTENILQVNLDRIAWRMQDKAFFKTVIGMLAARHIYNHTLWSYGVKHDDAPAIRQFLQFATDFVAQCGDWLSSPLLKIDPVVRKTYEHMDYRPLVNARVGQLGRQREILNDRFLAQYQRLLKILSYQPALDNDGRMAVTYYMLLQDRVEEAIGFFDAVKADQLATRLQHDYFTAYISFSKSEPAKAKLIAAKYADYPVDRWREAFANVVNQADEIENPQVQVADDEDRTQQQTARAASQPTIDFTIDARTVKLNFQNLSEVRVNYYLMDIELLFSRNPFVQGDSRQFGNILPNVTEVVKLPAKGTNHEFPLPKQLVNSNVLVEIVGGGVSASQAYYSNALKLQLTENMGQLRVTHGQENAPQSKVYVKVYARMKDGSVQFYKDGYTDLRGRFDYTSLSTNELDFVDKFALLILSDEFGAVVREANPPKQ